MDCKYWLIDWLSCVVFHSSILDIPLDPLLLYVTYDYDTSFVDHRRWYGNVARFINHSCTANLDIHSVFCDSHDIRLPRYVIYILLHCSCWCCCYYALYGDAVWDIDFALSFSYLNKTFSDVSSLLIRAICRIAFMANQYIKANTELTYDYGYLTGNVEGKHRDCLCGSTNCRIKLY